MNYLVNEEGINIEFFNVAALEKIDNIPGILLQRFPKTVRKQMGVPGYEKGRIKSQVSTGCEIRFVTDSNAVRVTLTAQETDGQVCVHLGDYFHSIHSLCVGVPKAILVDLPEELRKQRHEIQGRDRFAPELWRFIIGRGEGAMDIFSVAL